MPPEVFVVAGCHCGTLIRSNLRSFDVDQACTPVAGAAQSNELLNAARDAVAAAVVFKNLRRVLDSICALIVVSKYRSLQGTKSDQHQGHEGPRRKCVRPKAFVVLRVLGGSGLCGFA